MKKQDKAEVFAQEEYAKHMQVWMKFLLKLQYCVALLQQACIWMHTNQNQNDFNGANKIHFCGIWLGSC